MQRVAIRSLLVCTLVAVAAACGSSKSAQLDDLRAQADAEIAAEKPRLDALVARVEELRRHSFQHVPAWQLKYRVAQAANDQLGLWPFEQVARPGPGWKPVPPSLLGMGPYVHQHAADLAAQGKLDELKFLVTDTRRRYAEGIPQVDAQLTQVEGWLAAAAAQGSAAGSGSGSAAPAPAP